jgi:uncharacterized protein YcbK (DUF882 family)
MAHDGSAHRWLARGAAVAAAAVAALSVATPTAPGPHGPRAGSGGLAKAKGPDEGSEPEALAPDKLLGTLVHTHTNEHLPLGTTQPDDARFSAFLTDNVTGSSHALDPRLLGLLRTLAAAHPRARFEIVSGYRSEKLNESRRKKGRHVASHSQHTLGQAVDFRVVPSGELKGIDPRALEREIRESGWQGGVGVYTLASDWFVHADVGANRRWSG